MWIILRISNPFLSPNFPLFPAQPVRLVSLVTNHIELTMNLSEENNNEVHSWSKRREFCPILTRPIILEILCIKKGERQ